MFKPDFSIRFYYSLLNKEEKLLYENVFFGVLNRKTKFSYSYGKVDLNKVLNALWYDSPELFNVKSVFANAYRKPACHCKNAVADRADAVEGCGKAAEADFLCNNCLVTHIESYTEADEQRHRQTFLIEVENPLLFKERSNC